MMERLLQLAIIFKQAAQYWGKKASGILFVCLEDKTALLTKRSAYVHIPGTWGIPGGAVSGEGMYNSNEHDIPNPENDVFDKSAWQETQEELGSVPKNAELLTSVDFFDNGFTYRTFVYSLPLKSKEMWTPSIQLNWENDEARWFPFDGLPGSLHFGLKYAIQQLKSTDIGLQEPPDEPEEVMDNPA